MAVLLGTASFTTERDGFTSFGRPLGEDFAEFYGSGMTINRGGVSDLYSSRQQDEVYHRLFPRAAATDTLPFLYPPLVAESFRPLAKVRYPEAFALWLMISVTLAAVGILLGIAAIGGPHAGSRSTIFLACAAFEPLPFESLLGGQLSVVALGAVSGFAFLFLRNYRFEAGLALGICIYKPTLLIFIVPVLVVGRQWRTIAGFAVTSVALVGLSLSVAGIAPHRQYVASLLGQVANSSGTGSVAIKRFKFVDLNSFLHLLVGSSSAATVAVVAAMVAVAILIALWTRGPLDHSGKELQIALAVTATVTVNLYVAMYDAVLLIVAALLTFDALRRRDELIWLRRPLLVLIIGDSALAWVTQPIARSTGVQLFTVGLLALLVLQFIAARTLRKATIDSGNRGLERA